MNWLMDHGQDGRRREMLGEVIATIAEGKFLGYATDMASVARPYSISLFYFFRLAHGATIPPARRSRCVVFLLYKPWSFSRLY